VLLLQACDACVVFAVASCLLQVSLWQRVSLSRVVITQSVNRARNPDVIREQADGRLLAPAAAVCGADVLLPLQLAAVQPGGQHRLRGFDRRAVFTDQTWFHYACTRPTSPCILCCIALSDMAVLTCCCSCRTVCLRMRATTGTTLLEVPAPQKALAEYAFSCLFLYLLVWLYMG